MRALDDAVSAGKVLYLGLSDTPAWVAAQASTLARCSGRSLCLWRRRRPNRSRAGDGLDLVPQYGGDSRN
jgi:aryl-alcohol dehydrogenase-like predicted oxidoreductase